ncbi:hypothetical protein MASR2M70_03500 [Bacillota bacterium]
MKHKKLLRKAIVVSAGDAEDVEGFIEVVKKFYSADKKKSKRHLLIIVILISGETFL